MQTSYLLTMQLKEEQVWEVGIIFLRPLKMKERPFRRRETLTVSHSVTFQKTRALINTAMENFFSQTRNHFLEHSFPTHQHFHKTYRTIQK